MIKSLNKLVFFPPLLILLGTVAYSIYAPESFLSTVQTANNWVLLNFGGLFSWSIFSFLLILLVVYFSPIAKIRIGGKDSKPLLSKWRWFAITLCTTIATGILFWGPAEPLYHLNAPPSGLGLEPGAEAAAQFSMSTLFLHWTLTPYGIYTIAGLLFALTYYNLKQPFSLSALFYPLFGERAHGRVGKLVDMICLYGLVAGMAASLGTGMLTLMGGMNIVLGIPESTLLLGGIGLFIVLTFIISAASGLMKGIRILSDINIKAFIGLALFIMVVGPTLEMFQLGWTGLKAFILNFIPRSLSIDPGIDTSWENSWTIFYWANWLAWAPITALFLGRLSLGYTVREYIQFNLLLPALFGGLWMVIFGGASMHLDQASGGQLYEVLVDYGEQNVIFTILADLPLGSIMSIIFLFIVFVSYVTAADSNTSAMSGICTVGISPDNPEAPLSIKLIWGILIGLVAWIMVTKAGVDGIRIISVLGGFPALFLLIIVALGLIRLLFRKEELS
ncbi:MAG TPA: BCCT family transporter [Saprospiraceae bacterium]|nr:BCCT family transporter [Saprospiraceae bacterium]